ncbi:MAG: hypothetical protein ACFFDN_38465 [Candidatus Hodarchaeota archaeon]
MTHILTIGLSSPNKAKELAQLYMSKEKPSYPDFLKKINSWAAPNYQGKYRTIALYECPDNKLYEAMVALTKRYNFYTSKGDYTFEILPLMSEADTLPIVLGK